MLVFVDMDYSSRLKKTTNNQLCHLEMISFLRANRSPSDENLN